jgi:hypothetical protein
MIYHFLGRVVRRAWPLLLALWAALLIGTWWAAPPWDTVAQDREFAFLPADAPSRQAAEVFARAFPLDHTGSNIVLVLHRADNPPGHLDADRKFIEDVLRPALVQIADDAGGLADPRAAAVPRDSTDDDVLFGGRPGGRPPAGPAVDHRPRPDAERPGLRPAARERGRPRPADRPGADDRVPVAG